MKSTTQKPWGNFQVIEQGENYLVKKISVIPKGRLSLQSHQHRSEHWTIVQGKAEVNLNDKISIIEPNQSIFIPIKAKHSLANKSETDLIVIEVWYGKILDEEDITRYEDIYGRV